MRERALDQRSISAFAERSVDYDRAFSLREFLIRFYIRRWILLLCVLVMLVPTLGFALLTPTTWVATVEILIRYSSSESVFLKDLIPDNRATLSGSVMGEILRSLPTLTEAVKRYHIEEGDLYQEPMKAVAGKLARLVPFGGSSDPDRQTLGLAKTLQASLEESSKASSASRTRPVEILGRDSQIPQAQKADEFLTITVRSFNRLKVAEMANGLAEVLIDRYYDISAEDAHRSYEFLSTLAGRAQEQLRLLENDPDSPLPSPLPEAALGSRSTAGVDSPQIARLTNDLAAKQTELGRTQQFFRDKAPQVQRLLAEIAGLKQLLRGQERVERAKAVLQEISARRYQALNTENLYRSRLVPISIVQSATTPPPSPSAAIARIAGSAVLGTIVGLVLGGALATIFGALDDRIFTPADAERALLVPVFGWLPRLRTGPGPASALPDANHVAALASPSGVLRILSQLDARGLAADGSIVAIASSSDGDGKSLIALLLAEAVSTTGRGRVLLVDADPARASLSKHFANKIRAGQVDPAPVHQDASLSLLPAAAVAACRRQGSFLERLRTLLDAARSSYDLVIVDTPSFGSDGEAVLCCMAADTVLLVVKSGVTRRDEMKSLIRSLEEAAIRPKGAILNGRNSVVPTSLDRGA